MFAVQFVFNDNYTVINFMCGDIFSDYFFGFTILIDILTEFGRNLSILAEIATECSRNHNLSIIF